MTEDDIERMKQEALEDEEADFFDSGAKAVKRVDSQGSLAAKGRPVDLNALFGAKPAAPAATGGKSRFERFFKVQTNRSDHTMRMACI